MGVTHGNCVNRSNSDPSMEYVEAIRSVMKVDSPWVLFKHGTFVVIDKPIQGKTLEEVALEALEAYGQVMAGCPAGDFNVVNGDKCAIVTGHCPFMYTCVLPGECQQNMDMFIGLYGRNKRNEDWNDKEVIHVEKAENR